MKTNAANLKPPQKKQKTEHAIMEILEHSTGDMVVRVGKGHGVGLLRVHKALLTAVSPVFRGMLNDGFVMPTDGFLERTRSLGEKDPLVLEDDRIAFTNFCRVVHHQKLAGASKVDCVVKIAVIADKYSCMETILPPLLTGLFTTIMVSVSTRDPAIQKPIQDSMIKDLLNIIIMAYWARDSDSLWQWSRYAVLNLKGSDLAMEPNVQLASQASRVIPAIVRVREALLRELQYDCGAGVRAASAADAKCHSTPKKIGDYTLAFMQLKEHNDVDLDKCNISLASAWERLQEMADDLTAKKLSSSSCGHRNPTQTLDCKIDLLQFIKPGIAVSRRDLRVICLRCESAGKSLTELSCQHYEGLKNSDECIEKFHALVILGQSLAKKS